MDGQDRGTSEAMAAREPCDIISESLARHIGPHTARTAVRTFSHRALGVTPEAVSMAQVQLVLSALRPTLETLLGDTKTDEVLREIEAELGSQPGAAQGESR